MSDNMNGMYENESHPVESAPRWISRALIALALLSVTGLVVGWNAASHARKVQSVVDAQLKTLQQDAGTLNQRLVQAEQTNAQLQNDLVVVTDRLKLTQGELTSTRRQTTQIRSEYSKKMDSVQSELATKAAADDVKALGGDVTGVKNDLAATANGLQMTRGEFGTLIARNHDEIDQLRRMGEREYYEFTLTGKGNRSRVGNLSVELRGTNPKKNQFTVALYVDDMRLEKKNRSVDEPIYFYTRGTRVPLEMVINSVDKDKLVGYLSVPKMQGTTSASAAAR